MRSRGLTPHPEPIPGHPELTVMYAKGKGEYFALPAAPLWNVEGAPVIIRYRLSWADRVRLLFRPNLYLSLLSFWRPLTPHRLDHELPEWVSEATGG
jgi:hypothetical protein